MEKLRIETPHPRHYLIIGLFFLHRNQGSNSLIHSCSSTSHSPKGGKNQRSKWTHLYFTNSFFVSSLLLMLKLSIKRGNSSATVAGSSWIKHPYIEKNPLVSHPYIEKILPLQNPRALTSSSSTFALAYWRFSPVNLYWFYGNIITYFRQNSCS